MMYVYVCYKQYGYMLVLEALEITVKSAKK